jgi:ribosomal protein S10
MARGLQRCQGQSLEHTIRHRVCQHILRAYTLRLSLDGAFPLPTKANDSPVSEAPSPIFRYGNQS